MHRTRALLVALLFTAVAAHAASDSNIHRTFSVKPGGTLNLDADAALVRVKAGGNGVTVGVTQHGTNTIEYKFAQNGNDVTVTGKREGTSSWFNWNNNHTEIDVTVPSTYNLHVSTSGGDIEVGDLTGTLYLRTSGGDIDLGRINGPIDARTSGGEVKLESSNGKTDLRTSGGSIEARRVGGDLYARTSGGSITVEDSTGAIDAETSGGSIHATFSQQPRGDSRLSTSGGGVTVGLASNIALEIDARASGGGVDSDVPVTIMGHQDDDTLKGTINGGGPHLVVRTSGGGIRVKRS